MFGQPKYFFALPDRDELITFPVLKSPFKATADSVFYFPWLEGVWLLLVQSHFYLLPEMKWLKRTSLGASRGLRKNIFHHSSVGKTRKKITQTPEVPAWNVSGSCPAHFISCCGIHMCVGHLQEQVFADLTQKWY